jgi:phosphohistidine phosphatase
VKRLLLLRHAKTVPGGPGIDDHARKLSARGREDAPLMGRYMRKNELIPELVLCSTSRRTVETVELVVAEWKLRPETEYIQALYLAAPHTIVEMVRDVAARVESVMVVGHNPGMEACAGFLAREPVKRRERDHFDAIEEKFPTGALAVLDFDVVKWRKIAQGTGVLADFVRPRDL